GRLHINPEKITLCRPDAPPKSGLDIVGTVVLAMAEGDKIRVVVNIGVLLAALMDRASYQQCAPQIGATVRVRFAADAITLLDAA
ncbi:TOBE domain-containing protein, partial [Desulfobulbus sp.]|uniref:TOBE domain-containing protein n=1 Tax=Desulfobulbus sp. TaxID=895 RepID=UPI0027BB2037